MSLSTIISNLTIAAIAFLAPIQAAMIAVGLLIAIDTIFGIIAAVKSREQIQSRKFARVLIKLLAYQLLIVSAHLAQSFLSPLIPFVNITLVYVAISEFMSIGENFSKITGSNFIKYLKDILNKYLNKAKEV